jgi:ribosomal protein S27E
MRYIEGADRFSIHCKVCGITLCRNRSGNKAKKVAEQHDRLTGHIIDVERHKADG